MPVRGVVFAPHGEYLKRMRFDYGRAKMASGSGDIVSGRLRNLALNCSGLKPGERALVVSEDSTRRIGEGIAREASALASSVRHIVSAPLARHGVEPEPELAEAMLESDAIFCLTKMSLAHSSARRAATGRGARFLSLPDYSEGLLLRESLDADFAALAPLARRIAELFDRGRTLRVRGSGGTDISCRIDGRQGNSCPGACLEPGSMGSPPDAESNVAPLEDASEGLIIVDGSIPFPGFGLLKEPLELQVERGRVTKVSGPLAGSLERLYDSAGWQARVVAEIGIGLNPLATLCGVMLEDEGALGTVHFGMGSNATIGGANKASIHIDHVVRGASVEIDGVAVMKDGKPTLEELG